jgi:hypothetical protein
MENTIMVKGTVHKLKQFSMKDGAVGTSFSLAVYTGKVGGEYAPTLWFNVTSYDPVSLHEKQKDVVIDGYFKAEKSNTDGWVEGDECTKIYTKLIAKRVLVPNATPKQAPQSVQNIYGDLPF